MSPITQMDSLALARRRLTDARELLVCADRWLAAAIVAHSTDNPGDALLAAREAELRVRMAVGVLSGGQPAPAGAAPTTGGAT